MSLTDRLYGIIFEPAKTLKIISEEKPVSQALIVFLVVIIFNAVVNQSIDSVVGNNNVHQLAAIQDFVWIFSLFAIIIAVVLLFVQAGLYSLLGDVIYSQQNGRGLLASLSFAHVPGVLGPALYYAGVLAGINWLGAILSLAVSIWVLILQVLAVRESLGLYTYQAVFIFLLPVLVMILLLVVILVVLFSVLPLTGINPF
ncbi:hypothetical protein SYNTR_2108 [Candidatus Syntrophocurvum alkaliphilum]|uniref:Yip1 domain-containing protein n=1 Tax=Candidatus Syntrophocurvum alkaliphilum TaxID=2293317 RepID=A0A6I6DDZ8_9FIRM|nr:YIP1 family protein [Candidatus Syntrophocurvum alkaliphilum]QGU00702.1 hypothetical protein SYNTR_2108 [Candidatus Syntrophocurvum alkaliphilum]